MMTAYIIIGGVSVVSVGYVLLERQLVKRDAISAAELLTSSMDFTMKYGKIGLLSYFLYRIITMF